MSEWRNVTLGELCNEGKGDIRTGPFGSQLHESDYSEVGTPVVMPKDIATGRVEESTIARVSMDHVERLSHHKLAKGDIIYGRRGDIGRKALVSEREAGWLCGTGCLRITVGHHTDSRFLFYRLGHPETVSAIRNRAVGSTMPNLNTTILREVELTVPSLKTQREIAGILGAYDDLIEVNRRRISVLEEMARGLFTEWFIRLRFPGHENVAIDNTADGPLPAKWSWGTAGDLLLFDPRTRVPREGEKPFIPMGHLDTSTSLTGEPEMRSGNSGAKFRNGDTLFARITPCLENGKTGLVRNLPGTEGVGFGSTEFIVMRGERAGPAFSYCLSRLPAFREHARMSMSGATGRQRARTDSVAEFPFAIPPTDNLFERFEKIAWPMLELVGQIGLSNKRLAAARDLLLPRLISGQLSVAEAEQQLKAA